ncbi:hypothetical protein [Streptomyces sp. CB01881]|uniref:hypothetical protein n=1 Tax=Streptomyces sp. CB01881 TaxID=2078691 RepID=UPI001F11DD65|nr:hypothetical protein [Streptomyces sp. CB01881]
MISIAATAAHHGPTVLHDDADYRTVARHAPDLDEYGILDHARAGAPRSGLRR